MPKQNKNSLQLLREKNPMLAAKNYFAVNKMVFLKDRGK
jgi:hypothetical protein